MQCLKEMSMGYELKQKKSTEINAKRNGNAMNKQNTIIMECLLFFNKHKHCWIFSTCVISIFKLKASCIAVD